MNLKLENQRVLVFGAASGLGKAVAQAFREEGARVCGADLVETGENFLSRVDISNFAEVNAFVERVATEWGGIDHAICTAAKGSGKFGFPFWNLHPEDWNRVLEVTLVGSVHVATAVQPWLCAGNSETGKSLLFFTSVAGQMGSQTDPPYSAAKAGIINFMQCAARDFAPYGVRVNALSPGMVKTPLNQAVWAAWREQTPEKDRLDYEEWAEAKIKSIAPLGRWQEAEEFGAMAVYLASPFAKNITGQTINIDGGQVMRG